MIREHGTTKATVCLVVLLVLWVTMATGKILTLEKPCLREGGICVEPGTCDEIAPGSDLCPESKGVCCHGVPTDENDCKGLGAVCTPKSDCMKQFSIGQRNCGKEELCCYLP
ncbi:U-scoloptoxin(19)-Tl1a-like [Uloborus diversus]|uniref:U-scoloptoxin(19)-Tl1a-like n=1 Tax=Uloborus diversus TaxID=327109 RepID=UPI00240936C0|nr:U-scoloptoxin(19)-Tl1a-like [Uloborus diversus]XP_054722108.1 U-scoloptoxin(19)-Tl1a-like [Uloborus diversus]